MDFRSYVRNLAKDKVSILEIGPSYNPILPKREGYRVFIADHADQNTLKEKYRSFGVDPSRIEAVDFVTTDLASIKETGLSFDLILASHVIEHVTDFIKFINDCDDLLSDGGQLALIIPDKRYCFDSIRPLTSPGAIIDAHIANRSLHIGGLFDHYLYFCRNKGQMAWGISDSVEFDKIGHSASDILEIIKRPLLMSDYVDAHEWVLVPANFRLIIKGLRETNFIRTGIECSYPTLGYEFLAILSRNANPDNIAYDKLLQEIHDDFNKSTPDKAEQLEIQNMNLLERIAELEAKNASLSEQATSLATQNHCLRSSSSWRITQPLRHLKDLIRKNT